MSIRPSHESGSINWFDFSNAAQPPYLALLLNFAVLAGLYWYFGRRPLANALKQHRATIEQAIFEAQRLKQEAEARAKNYQAKLDKVEEELRSLRKALLEAGKAESERARQDTEQKIKRLEKETSFLVEQEKSQKTLELLSEALKGVTESSEALLRKQLTQADHERLAEEYLPRLEHEGKNRAIPPPSNAMQV